jgi:hypothetical protein
VIDLKEGQLLEQLFDARHGRAEMCSCPGKGVSVDKSGCRVYKGAGIEGIPIDSGLIFPFAGSVLVSGREQLLL